MGPLETKWAHETHEAQADGQRTDGGRTAGNERTGGRRKVGWRTCWDPPQAIYVVSAITLIFVCVCIHT